MEIVDDSNRHLIPRWHTSRRLTRFSAPGTVTSNQSMVVSPAEFRLDEAINDWQRQRKMGNAVELLAKLKLMNSTNLELMEDVRNYLAENRHSATKAVWNLLDPVFNPLDSSPIYCTDSEGLHEIIRKLKSRVRLYRDDALSWNDLGFYYAVLGQREQANYSMRVAFESSKRNPLIARAFARFLLEGDYFDPERALFVINQSKKIYRNPFLDSAELAIQLEYDVGTPNLAKALKLVERNLARPDLISELSASIATEEIKSGAIRNARKRLAIAAISPTENTVSQLHWIHNKLKVDISSILQGMQSSVEAKVLELYRDGSYDDCREELMKLHEFQPFSAKAIVGASYISLTALDDPHSVISTFNRYISVANKSLIARNNYSVALIEVGEIAQAAKIVSDNVETANSDSERNLSKATKAMLLYRLGQPDMGRSLYEQVLNAFRLERRYSEISNLLYYFGKEEAKRDIKFSLKLLQEAKSIMKEKDVGHPLREKVDAVISDLDATADKGKIKLERDSGSTSLQK